MELNFIQKEIGLLDDKGFNLIVLHRYNQFAFRCKNYVKTGNSLNLSCILKGKS